MKSIQIRKARMPDVRAMHHLLSRFADKREVLPRSISEIYENLQQFFVADDQGRIIGTCALYVTWDNLAEIKALVVDEKYQGKGLGTRLLEACLETARGLQIRRLFTLTIRSGFFEHFGFRHVDKESLPHKVWTECVRCIYFPDRCVEYAMVKDLPGKESTPPPDKDLPSGTLTPSEPMVPGASIPRAKEEPHE
jgi:amino-acid N-acetyltransferase